MTEDPIIESPSNGGNEDTKHNTHNLFSENILAIRSCKESIEKNMKVKSRLVMALFVVFASVVLTATLNNNSVDELFHVKITDLWVICPLAISLLSAFLVIRLASLPERIENLFGCYECSHYDILRQEQSEPDDIHKSGQVKDNDEWFQYRDIFRFEQAKANRVKLIDEFSSGILAISLSTFLIGCFRLLLTAPSYSNNGMLKIGSIFFFVISLFFAIQTLFRCKNNGLPSNIKDSLFFIGEYDENEKDKFFYKIKKRLADRKNKKNEGKSNKIQKYGPTKTGWLLAIFVICITAVPVYSLISIDNDNVENLTDVMIFETKGLYDDDTKGYIGTWKVTLQDGKVISSKIRVMPAEASSVHQTIDLNISNPIHYRSSGYLDHLPDKNQLLKGTTYLGVESIITLNYGEKDLSVYADNDTRYYVDDDDGRIYRAILMAEIIGTDKDNIKVVFDLSSPNSQSNGG
jgi:hypothetical protein